jgi:rSAM/selenodomain-associated transferase 1
MHDEAKRILMVVAKAPMRGQAKTRLGATIGLDAAAELYQCLLLDVLDIARRASGVTPAIAYTPAGSEAFFYKVAPDFTLVLQQGDNLGARLDHVLTACLNDGYSRAAVMSSDTPLVDPAAITQAFGALDDGHDVALGPCEDGGYYLMAVKQPQPGLLRPIRMSTPRVLQDTLAAAARHNLRVVLLPTTSDIDTADDLGRIQDQLIHLPPHVAKKTRVWLQQQLSST